MNNDLNPDDPTTWPDVQSAMQDESFRQVVAKADIVLGHDKSQGPAHQTVFGGKRVLEHIAKTGQAGGVKSIVRLSYDQRDRSLEYFAAACQVLRGSCDYESGHENAEFRRLMREGWGGQADGQ